MINEHVAPLALVFLLAIRGMAALPTDESNNTNETPALTLDTADKPPPTAEQQDPLFQGMGGGMGGYGQFPGMGGFGPQENSVNFDFQCKCKAKSNLPANIQVPTDANAAAQQQITQLQDQIRRLQEQVRRAQAGQSNFEQFAHILAMADGLDCNCSGSSAPFSNFPFGQSGGGQMPAGFGQSFPFMGGNRLMGGAGGPMMGGQRIFPGMSAMGGMFP
ncbi:hypothetical protein M3Y99_01494400 [Aphelenchoides fujianensis]|nr:hypothetical protein M3Y99_01494400 [Aphelenchoides fujianensis]